MNKKNGVATFLFWSFRHLNLIRRTSSCATSRVLYFSKHTQWQSRGPSPWPRSDSAGSGGGERWMLWDVVIGVSTSAGPLSICSFSPSVVHADTWQSFPSYNFCSLSFSPSFYFHFPLVLQALLLILIRNMSTVMIFIKHWWWILLPCRKQNMPVRESLNVMWPYKPLDVLR